VSRGFINTKYRTFCDSCGKVIDMGERVFWNITKKRVTCFGCAYKVTPPKEEEKV